MKKALKIFGIIAALVLLVIIVAPFVINVDKYRPQIVKIANENINGELQIGKLSLSLWGHIRVQVDGVKLLDQNKKDILSVKEAYFHFPFASLLSGSPEMIFKMDQPVVNVVKDKSGKMNLMGLAKTKTGETKKEAPAATQAPATGAPSQPVELPAIATRARLGFELKNAMINYMDHTTGLSNQLADFNVVLKDISLSRAMTLAVWSDLDTKMGKTMQVKGPFRIDAKVDPKFNNADFESAKADVKMDFDRIEILMPGLFHKKSSVPAHMEGKFFLSTKGAQIEKFFLKFHNAEINASGSLNNPETPVVQFEFKSNEIDMAPWAELVPMLGGYELGGSLALRGKAEGPSEKLKYEAFVDMKNWTAQSPQLKTKPVINGQMIVKTDQLEKFEMTMKAPANDLRVLAKVQSFEKPQVNVAITSTGMDLDQLIKFPPPPPKKTDAEKAKEVTAQKAAAEAAKNEKEPDFDSMLDPLRENQSARQSSALVSWDFKTIKAYDILISGLEGRFTFKNLVAAIESFKLKIWKGTIASNFSIDLKPKQPAYSLSTSVNGLDIRQAVQSQLELFRNTLYGVVDFSMKGSGASLNPTPAKKNLNVRGNFKVVNATFATIDVAKMTSEGINGAMEKIGNKVPQLKGKTVRKLPNRESKYDMVSSDFSIQDGVFSAPNFFAKAHKDDGVDIKGNTTLGLIDYKLNAKWTIIDTYNLTQARNVDVNVNGTQVNHVLAKGSDPVSFPVTVSCTAFEPCYSYTEVGEHLGGIAASNVAAAVSSKYKAQAVKQAEKVIEKAPEPVKKAAEGIKKKFGF